MTMTNQPRVLVVDDEQNIRLTLNALLSRAGYAVTTAATGEEAVELFERESFDLMLVDLQMPGMKGMEVVAKVREAGHDAIIIVLTGHGSLDSAIEGIRYGIFDYLLKTSDPNQILARVAAGLEERAARRRQSDLLGTIGAAVQELTGGKVTVTPPVSAPPAATPPSSSTTTEPTGRILTIGPLTLDTWHQTATLNGRSLNLTPTEFRLLLCLAEHAGQMLSYTQLVRCAQGYETTDLEAGELIKPHIHHLRQKIEPEPSAPRYLLNVRGKGYILQI
ncbi:two component transcriptional regulator, winged helix family [Chloroflexus aggregans DSM 9485]|uniref:Two component transcriptional regulator, winged helix family n=2 Tax=Chloroflexus aggregans TaxID=152260 RepID=B8GD33_CHLAD|nr:response regulator transcription factor [Chloroflexus aggregans]ACL25100.1 two component transcriptional regulator, winged helix family [Chloroflexus aggregans DSM 9485]